MIAILEAKRAGLLERKHWLPNIVAGIIVGIVALPLAMAFAIASGVKPEQGIYTAIIAGLAVSLFGGSRVQIAGPTGAFIVILSGVVAQHGIDGLQIATLMAGVMLLILGFTRMGAVIKFIPAPVIVGFTAGIGIIIWVGQWKDFFGLPTPDSNAMFHEQLWFLLQSLPSLSLTTTLLALLSLFLVIITPRIKRMERVPGPLVALIVASLIQAIFQFESVATIGSAFGEIPRGLPGFQLPEITLNRVLDLVGPAFAIAMLGAIESLLSAVVADNMSHTRHNSNQELVGQGIANVLAPLFGGIAATGAIARTATNIRNGGTSPIAGIVHVLVLVLVLLVLAPLAVYIPLASLAAILFMVAWNMSQPKTVYAIVREAPWADVFILVVTLLITVFANLVVAVNIGVVLAMLHFLKRMSDSVSVEKIEKKRLNGLVAPEFLSLYDSDEEIKVLSVEGPFFYAGVDVFERRIENLKPIPKVLVLRMRYVPFMDGTALQVLEKTILDLQQADCRVVMSELNPHLRRQVARAGLLRKVRQQLLFETVEQALQAAHETLREKEKASAGEVAAG
ncbi:SulP family inorganic anion transporter [Paenalcaligenes suwonensis]|uniref:SulP family inorganic anion transporter n=1 Tax=Paenalcaligenes suwonensis TaxID=1202713 RepID=UPI00140B1DE1|nr:SulP family inorganic anion transporter [Paenalcaligenes suwonensis]NHC61870.1 STAS domain-containing protein [Paenalcaligenes suwonensis]